MAETTVEKVSILGQDTIHVGLHLTPHIAHTVLSTLPSSTYALITDSHLASLHLQSFSDLFTTSLQSAGSSARFLSYVVPPGEGSKSRQGKAAIEDWLLNEKCTRDTVLLAMGGGVIGDLVGFVAATFMRGIRYVQIPTTLLAMVDSSVGGKTAIDTPAGKNLIGAFWQPSFVFIDAAFLGTLPPREFANGMAEVVKTAAIWDADEFSRLETRSSELLSSLSSLSSSPSNTSTSSTPTPAQALLLHTIRTSVHVKAHIVTLDERETGLRNLVNFGHTIGHALEAVLTPEILHGEAVAVGIVLEAEVARARGVLGQVSVGRLVRCLSAYGLPTSMADPRIAGHPRAKELTVDRLLGIMAVDKKNSGKEKKIVLLSSIGKTYEEKASTVSDELIARTLAYSARVISGRPDRVVELATPGSKSISNRALVLAALSGGTTRLTNLLHSDDTAVMMAALKDLQGATFGWEDGGETLVVHGTGGKMSIPPKGKELYLGNAGTAARFLTAVCALVGSTPGVQKGEERTVITGNKRMKQRPIGPLVDALQSNGAQISYLESQGCLPLSIGPEGLKGGRIELAASVSSQYVSAVLLCAPYAREADVELALVGGEVISQPYIDMTIAMMRSFGVDVQRVKDGEGKETDVYRIPRKAYSTPGKYAVESDASSATYPLAIAAITGTEVIVKSIGSASLQGDARFAKEVLEPMGCEVIQTPDETRVKGPPVGQLRAIGEVDMETMTDAFLTASVLAAVARGPVKEGRKELEEGRRGTRILGIKNQRVKECNRIRAMIDELGKFGVQTKELDDGLEIYGMPVEELKEGVVVHCYDDHRVAMAHSVLATIVNGTVLDEKRCVEKTWPNWWDDLENKIGLKVEGVELPHTAASSSSASGSGSGTSSSTTGSAEGSVLIIGMRGSGKTFIGAHAAYSLSWSLLDADEEFERVHSTGVREYVHTHGWPAFRTAETQLLNNILEQHPTKTVVSLGGGIVETPEAREVLKKWAQKGKVVRVVRDTKEVVKYLGEETARPAYGESVEDVVQRREPWYRECCTHAYVNHTGGGVPNAEASTTTSATESVRREVSRFFGQITGVRPNLATNLVSGKRSFFLSLTFPDVTPALAHIDELAAGADALELRVDLLRSPSDTTTTDDYTPSPQYVANQVALLRRATDLPLVYTVRTKAQGGAFPDSKSSEALALLDLGLRMGVEYLDVEINESWPQAQVAELLKKKGSTQIIGSWHDWTGSFKWDSEDAERHYADAAKIGDIVKIVGTAKSLEDNFALRRFVSGKTGKPFIAINMGKEGQLSRVLNQTFSPVTHGSLPSAAAPGQMTVSQIHSTLALLGQLPKQQFYLFGSPIQHSPSPTLHNTAFGALGLPHVYGLLESSDAQDEKIKDVLKDSVFGGASVTIPLKETIIPLLGELSDQAKTIGAVNTIIPVQRDGKTVLRGENTDWEGIVACVRASGVSAAGATGLVVGAGGTARAAVYALTQLGVKQIYIYNRTAVRAKAVKDAFPGQNIVVLEALGEWASGNPPSVIIGTVPADAQDAVVLQAATLLQAPKGVLVEMAYKPARTPLVALVEAKEGWTAVKGVEVLIEQGLAQQRHWNGRKAPREKVRTAVRDFASV